MWHNVCGWLQEKGVIVQKTVLLTWQFLAMGFFLFTQDEPFLLMLYRAYRQFWKVMSRVPRRGHVTLSADTVNFWSCTWICGWPRGAVAAAAASLGSALGFLQQRKHRHVTPIMTYIKTSHYVSKRERGGLGSGWNEMSPFSLQLMSDDDIICTGRAVSRGWRGVVHWLLLLALLAWCFPTNLNSTLWTREKSLCRKIQKISNMTCE